VALNVSAAVEAAVVHVVGATRGKGDRTARTVSAAIVEADVGRHQAVVQADKKRVK
jgi:hypothetical protein